MSRALPQPVTVNDILLAAAVEVLGEAVTLLGEIRDRLPQPNDLVHSAGTDEDAGEPVREPVHVTEPAPVKAPTRPAKKTASPKPGKET